MKYLSYLPALWMAALFANPAYAAGSIPLPEPSSMFLLALGIAGVAIGRKLSSKKDEEGKD